MGAKANCAKPMTVLNAIVAEQLQYFHDGVEELIQGKNMKKDDAILICFAKKLSTLKKFFLKGTAIPMPGEKKLSKGV